MYGTGNYPSKGKDFYAVASGLAVAVAVVPGLVLVLVAVAALVLVLAAGSVHCCYFFLPFRTLILSAHF